ncbi:hypothetical protein COW94_00825 [Candidatus Peregrinibacteria bacterium CG22_combo_CG10-13_8_21_14_all_44_10]|nr:MAG: hypothetical protein AUK45_01925 [Candidatus Peregrinibacteria bacterium CG2_30_44_17]PIP66639.1 MAG: hypothetical protein COW94_00825 [Candidatus Peregrinibacteria bacterium CG22_combo_CG10-13_8_21_14_all_44_10]PIS03789.1 MAG: hypothetical protein COT83_04205 [Candidatus Peregrinibacteria bacterium CG10_big_fil_rev_8_21_14_0_10_44_7]PIX79934.1 MAG: hypothetical protein COZ35_02230 [Candidatus Peregrinibacteria bacterium CG_4_10_14_3_um_filter_44_21]PJB88296.1 MAG: hypothetical protein 
MKTWIKLIMICAICVILLAISAEAYASVDQIIISTYQSETKLTAVIEADSITQPVIGMAFELEYDPTVLSYDSYDVGAFFEQGGEPIYLVTYDIDHRGGRVIVGITLRRSDREVDASGTIIALDFDIYGNEDTELEFKNPIIAMINEYGEREDLTSIEWVNTEVSMTAYNVDMITTEQLADPIMQESRGFGMTSVKDGNVADTIMANIFTVGGSVIVLSVLSLLSAICYIAWRIHKKYRHVVQTADSRITEPTEETIIRRSWS